MPAPNLEFIDAAIIERWDRLNDGQKAFFIESNERLRLKQEERDEQRAEREADALRSRTDRKQREKGRARAAYKLSKWQRADGSKIPSSEEGIVEHQQAVASYEEEFGSYSEIDKASNQKTYANMREQWGRERQAALDWEQTVKEAEEERRKQRELRAEAQREHDQERRERDRERGERDEARRNERARARLGRELKRYLYILDEGMPYYERSIASAQGENAGRNAGSLLALFTRYKDEAKEELAEIEARMPGVLEAAKDRESAYDLMRRQRAFDAGDKDAFKDDSENVEETPEAAGPWAPRWSKEKHSKYRELQNVPEHWGAKKVVLIWYGQEKQELRVFETPGGLASEMMLTELVGPGTLIDRSHAGSRWDFTLTPDQYEHASRAAS